MINIVYSHYKIIPSALNIYNYHNITILMECNLSLWQNDILDTSIYDVINNISNKPFNKDFIEVQ